ncbi:MAG: hypothetical protein JRE43_09180 [Deltaproteobacteria bacterium]|nr:hypothetical protein [Deltaproteobacteria bacterium]
MGKKKLPRPIERRHLIERELSTAQALGYAEAYLEAGLEVDAIAFLAKAEATEQLAALRSRSIELGDGFLLRAVAAATEDPPKTEEWEALAEAAKRAGKERYATDALRHAELGES